MDKINVVPQRAARNEHALSPHAKKPNGDADLPGSERTHAESVLETEFSKVTSRMKAEQTIDTSIKRPEGDGKIDLADVEQSPDNRKIPMEGHTGLAALLRQDATSLKSDIGPSGSPTRVITDAAVAGPKVAATVSSAGPTTEVIAQQQMTETGSVVIPASKNKPDAKHHVEVPMTPVYRANVNPQAVRRDGLTPSTDRTVMKTTGQSGSAVAVEIAPPSSPLPRESVKLPHAVEITAQSNRNLDDGLDLTVRTSRQETHLENVRIIANGTVADQVGKELQLQLQHSLQTQSADRSSSAEALRQQQAVDLQSPLSRPTQSEPLKTLTIQLRPDHLGTVTANLRLKGDVIQVELASAKAEVVQMIRQDRDIITDMLRSTGLMVSDDAVQVIELSQRTDGNTNNQGGDRERFSEASTPDGEQRASDRGGNPKSANDSESAIHANRANDDGERSEERRGIFI